MLYSSLLSFSNHSVIPLAVTIAVNYMAASKEVPVLSYRPFYEAFVKLVFAK